MSAATGLPTVPARTLGAGPAPLEVSAAELVADGTGAPPQRRRTRTRTLPVLSAWSASRKDSASGPSWVAVTVAT